MSQPPQPHMTGSTPHMPASASGSSLPSHHSQMNRDHPLHPHHRRHHRRARRTASGHEQHDAWMSDEQPAPSQRSHPMNWFRRGSRRSQPSDHEQQDRPSSTESFDHEQPDRPPSVRHHHRRAPRPHSGGGQHGSWMSDEQPAPSQKSRPIAAATNWFRRGSLRNQSPDQEQDGTPSYGNQSSDYEQQDRPQSFFPSRFVLFILATQFCERFTFYGLQEILFDYFVEDRNLTLDTVYGLLDGLIIFCYTFVILGAYIGDSTVGKFQAVVFSTVVYLSGCISLMLGTEYELPIESFFLLMIGIGAATMKPCLAALGGDQHNDFQSIRNFFFWFYLVTNLAALASIYLSPILASTFGFWVPVVTMCMTMGECVRAIFIAGKILSTCEVPVPPDNNSLLVIPCICHALKKKFTSNEKEAHWLDHATHKYGEQMVADVKQVIHVVIRFIPMPIFWAIYNEQWGAHMRKLSSHMNFFYGEKLVENQRKEFGFINPICVIVFILIFKYAIYPIFGLVRLLRQPLQRVVVGCMVAGVAYFIAGVVAQDALKNETSNGMLPVFIVLAAAEVLFAISAMEFAYTQAPNTMKCFVMACLLLTVAIGFLLGYMIRGFMEKEEFV